MANVTIDETKLKALLKETLIELLEENQAVFSAILVEALENAALANAIRMGRRNDFVSREEIDTLLAG